MGDNTGATSDVTQGGRLDRLEAALFGRRNIPNVTVTNNLANHEEVTGFLGNLKRYAKDFADFIDNLHIQTVVFDPQNDAPVDVTISVITSGDSTPTQNQPVVVKGKIKAIYDTTIKINGDVQSMYPSNPDAGMLQRHNTLVDQMWKSKTDTMTKMIDGVTGALKLV
jgi:hypothetical protein